MSKERMSESSNIFSLVETLGLVTDGIRPCVYQLGTESFIVSSLQRSYYVMNLSKLRMVFRSGILPFSISALYGSNENVYVGFKESCKIALFHRTSYLGCLKGHRYPVRGLFSLDTFLLSWSEYEVIVWDLSTCSIYGTLRHMEGDGDQRKISQVIHPETYINKIIVCYASTSDVELWNFYSCKLIYTFRSIHDAVGYSCGLTSVCATSHPEVVGLGCANGRVLLLDLQKDQVLAEFHHSQEAGAVTALTCRTDQHGSKYGIFLCGCSNGSITVWNAYENRLLHELERAHNAEFGVTLLNSLPNEPLVVSSGNDNSIIVWIFDLAGDLPRELRSRRGFTTSISSLQFYDSHGKELLCIGNEARCTLGIVTAFQQHQNCMFQQSRALTSITQKWRKPIQQLTPATGLSFCYARHYDWPNIVTCHKGLSSIFLWSGHDRTLIPRTIDLPRSLRENEVKALVATAVGVSRCGHYVVVGYNQGGMHKFNLQSGLYRKEFRFQNKTAHNGPVTQVQVISYSIVISVCATHFECCLRRWNLQTCEWLSDVSLAKYLPSPLTFGNVLFFKMFDLLTSVVLSSQMNTIPRVNALDESSDNQKIVILNSETDVLVREIPVVENDSVLTMEVSQDRRWLLYATTRQPYLYVYDILSCSLIDWMAFSSPVTSLAFDSSNAFLYLGLQGTKGGVLVLGNHHIFDLNQTNPILKPTPTKPILMSPFNSADSEQSSAPIPMEASLAEEIFFSSEAPLEKGRLTLSGMSSQRIESILHLDLIKQRNSDVQHVVKKNTSTLPFFLPTASQGNKIIFSDALLAEAKSDKSRPASNHCSVQHLSSTQSTLQKLLAAMHEANTEKNRKQITQYFFHLSPSGIDLALLQLGSLAGSTDLEYLWLLDYFIDSVYNREQADFIQALIAVFLKKHSAFFIEILQGKESVTIKDPSNEHETHTLHIQLRERFEKLRGLIKQDWEPFELLCHQASSFLKLLTHTQIE